MKWLKWTLLSVVGVVLLAAVLVIGFLATFDPNAYKEQAAAAVREQTGRTLEIPGDVGVSYFPWLGFELGRTRLGNATGFGEQPFAEVGAVKVKVEVLPLLRGVLRVDVVELEGLRLDLQKAANGVSNWDDLAGAPAAPGTGQAATAPAAGSGGGGLPPALAALSVGGVRIADAAVSYRDAAAGQTVRLSGVALETGRVTLGEPFELVFGAQASVGEPQIEATVKLRADLSADLERQRYAARGLAFDVNASGAALPGGRLALSVTGDVSADLAQQVAAFEDLRVRTGEIDLRLNGRALDLDRAPRVEAKLDLAAFDARALMGRFGIEPPLTADQNVLRKVAASGELTASAEAADIKALTLTLDDTRLDIVAAVAGLDAPQGLPKITARANVSAIDLDRYLPPEPPEGSAPAGDAPAGAGDDTPLGLPVELLRELDLEAQLDIARLTVKKLSVSDFTSKLVVRGGVVRLDPMNLALYEGLFKGKTLVDVRGEQPVFQVDAQLANVKSGPLLADFTGDDLVRGRADATLAITTSGLTVGQLKRGLNGRVAMAFQDGAVKGFNLAEQLRVAEAKLKRKDYASSGDRPTDFSAVSVSGVFRNGVLHTDDLDLRAPLLRLAGKGQVDVAGELLDYLATVTLTDKATGQGGEVGDDLRGLPVPIRVGGTFAKPKVSFELTNVLEGRARQALADEKARLEAKAREERARLEAKAAEEKARLAEEAERAKADLAAKAQAEKDRATAAAEAEKKKAADKLEEDVKGKLKKLF